MANAKDVDSKTLELVFRTKLGRTKTLVIYDQRNDASAEECQTVAKYFVDNNILLLSNAADEIAEFVEARFHTCEYVPAV
ncbi:DUF2922 domain-containing protein [uncultured Phascolarctobacterium sp.]|uniref:DUF2922 domain-containing protein n=1 Tax=uncultured Phascolarctobacterium sp. TaxID=512296 RepID=UPI00261EBE83|nr:DUF2922 domain-containing protein [uncultured Phascolarctobacterium sp.]